VVRGRRRHRVRVPRPLWRGPPDAAVRHEGDDSLRLPERRGHGRRPRPLRRRPRLGPQRRGRRCPGIRRHGRDLGYPLTRPGRGRRPALGYGHPVSHDGAESGVPFCDLGAAHAARGEAIEAALVRVARSGRYVLGPEVEAFESEWAATCRAAHAVGVGNGTDALALILRAADVGPGDEVVVPAYTAPATWMSVAWCGARPVGADVDPVTGLIDPEAAAVRCGPRT